MARIVLPMIYGEPAGGVMGVPPMRAAGLPPRGVSPAVLASPDPLLSQPKPLPVGGFTERAWAVLPPMAMLLAVAILGLWVPGWLSDLLHRAAALAGGQ
jgi:hypothetical protein